VFQKAFEQCLAKLDIAMAEMGMVGGTMKIMNTTETTPKTPETPRSIPEPPTPQKYNYNRGAAGTTTVTTTDDLYNTPTSSPSTQCCKKRLTYVSTN
jgi:hypothetical protein